MSGKELLKLDSKGLAGLSDAQLKSYFAPYLKMIRPEEKEEEKMGMGGCKGVSINPGQKRTPKGPSELDKTKELFNRMAKKMGIEGL